MNTICLFQLLTVQKFDLHCLFCSSVWPVIDQVGIRSGLHAVVTNSSKSIVVVQCFYLTFHTIRYKLTWAAISLGKRECQN
jgi:hypothetical protein